MATIAQLEEKGFVFTAATGAVECTRVFHIEPFRFYSPKFVNQYAALEKATPATQQEDPNVGIIYSFVTTNYAMQQEEFPFAIIMERDIPLITRRAQQVHYYDDQIEDLMKRKRLCHEEFESIINKHTIF